MAKGQKKSKESDVTDLNVEVPTDLFRRIGIAKAETGESIKQLVAEWCERGLADLADRLDRPYLKARKQAGNGPTAEPPRKPAGNR